MICVGGLTRRLPSPHSSISADGLMLLLSVGPLLQPPTHSRPSLPPRGAKITTSVSRPERQNRLKVKSLQYK